MWFQEFIAFICKCNFFLKDDEQVSHNSQTEVQGGKITPVFNANQLIFKVSTSLMITVF